MLLFNLNAPSQTEEITSAELHFYMKKQATADAPQSARGPPQGDDGRSAISPHSAASVARQRGETRMAGLRRYGSRRPMEGSRQTADLLAFRFDTSDPNADDWFRRVTVIRTDPSPFLIVFSNEVTNATPRPTINVWRAPSMIMNCPRLTSTATRCRPPVQVFCRPGAGHPVPGRIHPPNR